ncbi:hypothetical protein ARMSODRAFT_1007050 [Armillaria solidipes]|uniref:Uncharacterized protein n=1 Tax=Armillaria solidipes TaxID=1076256 RepID=A0A2H3BMZ2_9AGAR|nr:hypothetical protein ARMSODRAFT_1007050 [Armillaria solidipes]
MSSVVFPSRGQCTQVTDNVHRCQCPSFASPLLDPYICVNCGHGIHGHADYVSMVVHHYPPTQCAAYVQKTPLAQRCTCESQLCDHLPIDNLYRSAEPWSVLDYVPDNNGPSYSPAGISFSNDAINDPYTPSSMSFSRDANLMPITTAPVFSPTLRTSVPSSEVGNTSLAPASISSPSARSTSSGIQWDITQTQGHSPDDHFVQSLDNFMNDSYDRQPDGGATDVDENLYYHDHSNVIYGPTSEAWSGPYA